MLGLFNRLRSLLESGLLKGAVDQHSHILYGLDDGVKTQEDSLAILRYLEEQGVSEVWFTPHVMEDVPNTTEAIRGRFEELKAVYDGGLSLHLAAEYMMDTLFEERLTQKDLLFHGEDTVLVETSAIAPPIRRASFASVSFFSSRASYWAWIARKRWQSEPTMQYQPLSRRSRARFCTASP